MHAKENSLQALQTKKDNELTKVNEVNENNANTFKIGFGLFDLFFLLCSLYAWNFTKLVAIEKLANDLLLSTPADSTLQSSIDTQNTGSQDVPNTQQNSIPNQQNRIGFRYDFTHLKNKSVANDTPATDKNIKAANELPNEKDNKNLVFDNENKEIDSPTLNVNGESNTLNVNSERIIITLQANEKICLQCQTVFTHKHWAAKYCGDGCRITAWELRTGKTFTKGKK